MTKVCRNILHPRQITCCFVSAFIHGFTIVLICHQQRTQTEDSRRARANSAKPLIAVPCMFPAQAFRYHSDHETELKFKNLKKQGIPLQCWSTKLSISWTAFSTTTWQSYVATNCFQSTFRLSLFAPLSFVTDTIINVWTCWKLYCCTHVQSLYSLGFLSFDWDP